MQSLIETATIDEAISRSSNGIYFVKLLQSLKYSNNDIKLSIENFLNTPTQIGEWEKIMIAQAIQHLKQQQ